MFAQFFAAASGFDADQLYFLVFDKVMEYPDGVFEPPPTQAMIAAGNLLLGL